MRSIVLALVAVALTYSAEPARAQKTQVAVLVDTSGSTRHFENRILTEAKSFVSNQEANGGTVEMAAFAFGQSQGHFEAVPEDEDDFSVMIEERFAGLRSRMQNHAGGGEGFGRTLNRAFALEWSKDPNDRRIVLVFGNENFNQGNPSARKAIEQHEDAVEADERQAARDRRHEREIYPVVVHVRYVGPRGEGLDDSMRSWRVQRLTRIQSGIHPDANGAATALIVDPKTTTELPLPTQ